MIGYHDAVARLTDGATLRGTQTLAPGDALGRVLVWVGKAIAERDTNPPVDRKWLSQYVGDIQRAWEIGDRETVGHMLFDAEFNDRIYYTS